MHYFLVSHQDKSMRSRFRPASADTSAALVSSMGLPFEEGHALESQLWTFPGYHLRIFLACSYAQRLFL